MPFGASYTCVLVGSLHKGMANDVSVASCNLAAAVCPTVKTPGTSCIRRLFVCHLVCISLMAYVYSTGQLEAIWNVSPNLHAETYPLYQQSLPPGHVKVAKTAGTVGRSLLGLGAC